MTSPRHEPAEANGNRPVVIGWKEFVRLPDLGIRRVKAKIDTGARTSALDVFHYELQETEDGLVAELHLRLSRKKPGQITIRRVPVLRLVEVRNSGGMRQRRPLIETTLELGSVRKRILMTVADRAPMCFRMILGRKALEEDFVVDVSRKYLLRK